MAKKVLKTLALPIIFLVSIIVLFAVWNLLNLPSNSELVEASKYYFTHYGYPVLFFSAVIESIPIINIYYPGSSIILLAAAMSRDGTTNLWGVVFIVAAGIYLTYIINYLVGKYGLYNVFIRFGLKDSIDTTKGSLEKHGDKWLWITYAHPNFGALTALTCGIIKYPFKKFLIYSLLATVGWCIFWGVVSYLGAEQIMKIVTLRWLFILFIVVLILWKAITQVRKIYRSPNAKS
jgi:undecaprenyl-diphosphatase